MFLDNFLIYRSNNLKLETDNIDKNIRDEVGISKYFNSSLLS